MRLSSFRLTPVPDACENYRQLVEESIKDEIWDAGFCAEIAKETRGPARRRLIAGIAEDELSHAKLQAALLGIGLPPASQPPACPSRTGNFQKDAEAFLLGKLEDIAKYAGLAAREPDLRIRQIFLSILGDEYAHTRILVAMLPQVKAKQTT